jgi:formylglycine-generating enzyme required for sulfatase activity
VNPHRRDAVFPWGDAPPNARLAVFDRHLAGTAPVDTARDGASAIGCLGMAGGVWEWTSSAFAPYPGFAPWPYAGYSQPYFDGRHQVLRGGSWASRRTALRNTFRNWYAPETTAVFAGVRVLRPVDAGTAPQPTTTRSVRYDGQIP